MGYEIIKPTMGGVASSIPYVGVTKTEISLNTLFVKERGWRTDKKYYAVLMRDTETGKLCIDFHDDRFPSAFMVRWKNPASRALRCNPSCSIIIPKGYAFKPGRYSYKFDGRICKTDIIVEKAGEGK